jgi:hypothetical protein
MQTTEATPVTGEVAPVTTAEKSPKKASHSQVAPMPAVVPADPQKPLPRPGIDEAAPGGRWTIEVWAKRKRTPPADLRTAKIIRHWPVGRVVTEAEFDAGISDGRNLVFR